jgi:hypothetical protein
MTLKIISFYMGTNERGREMADMSLGKNGRITWGCEGMMAE